MVFEKKGQKIGAAHKNGEPRNYDITVPQSHQWRERETTKKGAQAGHIYTRIFSLPSTYLEASSDGRLGSHRRIPTASGLIVLPVEVILVQHLLVVLPFLVRALHLYVHRSFLLPFVPSLLLVLHVLPKRL